MKNESCLIREITSTSSGNLEFRIEKLSPKHAFHMKRMYEEGTNHIARYLVWGKDASNWSVKECLFWIQDRLREPMPNEYFVFFRGNQMIGVAALGAFKTGYGSREDARHVQMSYWLGKNHLGKKYGDQVVLAMENIAFVHRKYSYMHIIHDSSNHTVSHMATRLGYKFENYYDSEIKALDETGLFYSWIKANPKIN